VEREQRGKWKQETRIKRQDKKVESGKWSLSEYVVGGSEKLERKDLKKILKFICDNLLIKFAGFAEKNNKQ